MRIKRHQKRPAWTIVNPDKELATVSTRGSVVGFPSKYSPQCVIVSALAVLLLAGACRASALPQPEVTIAATGAQSELTESTTSIPPNSAVDSSAGATEDATLFIQLAAGEGFAPVVGAEMPPGWRLSEPVAPSALAGAARGPVSEILSALGRTPVRVATMTDAAADAGTGARPTVLLYAVPNDDLSLAVFLALLADQLAQEPDIAVTGQGIDFTLAAGKGSVGLLQYEQRPSASDPPLYGQIAVVADGPTGAFLLLVALSVEADSPVVADLFGATVPTLAIEPNPIQSNNP